jgi:hypothetical protein
LGSNVYPDIGYLENFLGNLLLEEKHVLRIGDLRIHRG